LENPIIHIILSLANHGILNYYNSSFDLISITCREKDVQKRFEGEDFVSLGSLRNKKLIDDDSIVMNEE